MGLYDDDEGFDDFDDEGGQPQGIKAVRAAQKKAAKEAAELREQNVKLQRQLTRFTLRDVLEKKGLRTGLARAMVNDGVDASDDKSIQNWLADQSNQEDYQFSLEAGASSAGQPGSDRAADFAAFQGAQGNPLPADHSRLAEAARLMDSASSDEEIQAALNAAITR